MSQSQPRLCRRESVLYDVTVRQAVTILKIVRSFVNDSIQRAGSTVFQRKQTNLLAKISCCGGLRMTTTELEDDFYELTDVFEVDALAQLVHRIRHAFHDAVALRIFFEVLQLPFVIKIAVPPEIKAFLSNSNVQSAKPTLWAEGFANCRLKL